MGIISRTDCETHPLASVKTVHPTSSPEPPLRPPQFRLRTLLLLLALCGGLLALTQWLPPLTVVGIAFFLLCVAAHVAGNAIGTRLRQHPAAEAAAQEQVRQTQARLSAADYAPQTRLGESDSLGWPLLAATLVGLIGGGVLGGCWVILKSPEGPAELDVVVGIVACAILGGIFTFVGVGFLQVGGSAIWQTLQKNAQRRGS